MRKLIRKKNISLKSVNNHKTKSHKFYASHHNVSKGLEDIYKSLAPIYQSLSDDFEKADLCDLEFYERWLHG